ncbi:MAG: hypothetical protein SFT92_06465 [Rickettsiales bacterium]|nr:hypothetical protein [Rickettsiales bacterium]
MIKYLTCITVSALTITLSQPTAAQPPLRPLLDNAPAAAATEGAQKKFYPIQRNKPMPIKPIPHMAFRNPKLAQPVVARTGVASKGAMTPEVAQAIIALYPNRDDNI